jgi:hypothetical protein
VNDPLGSGLVQLLGRQVVFRLQAFGVTLARHGEEALDLRLDRLLDGPVGQASFFRLSLVLFGTLRMRHRPLRFNPTDGFLSR